MVLSDAADDGSASVPEEQPNSRMPFRPPEPVDMTADSLARESAGALFDHLPAAPRDSRSEVDEAVGRVLAAPASSAERRQHAAELVTTIMRGPHLTDQLRHLAALLEITDDSQPDTPDWRQTRARARAMVLMWQARQQNLDDPREALRELDQLERQAGGGPGVEVLFRSVRSGISALAELHQTRGLASRAIDRDIRSMRELAAIDSVALSHLGASTQLAGLITAYEDGDDLPLRLAELQRQVQHLPAGRPLREAAEMLMRLRGATADSAPLTLSPERLSGATAGPTIDLDDSQRRTYLLAAGAALLGGGRETDPERVDLGIAQFRTALTLTRQDDPQHVMTAVGLALGLLRRAELTNSAADLDEAAGLLEQARATAGPQHPLWPVINESLSQVRRRLGDTDSRRHALAQLRDPAAAGRVMTDAIDLARLCIANGVPTDAIHAMEAGLCGPDQDPPNIGAIRHALTVLDLDALVYLIPGGTRDPGFALIAPAAGTPKYMALPFLTSVPGPDAVHDWAWQAAIGPLLEQYAADLDRPGTGRPPRLALAPLQGLAGVPWQAARRPDGTYALQLAAFSRAVSGSQLCRSAALAPVSIGPSGLLVADPDAGTTGLTDARIAAYAVRQAFYPGGRYLGRRPDGNTSRSGAGTLAEVLGWLGDTGPAAGTMLHLGCAITDGGLRLADGPLPARRVIEEMARIPDRTVGLVVLPEPDKVEDPPGLEAAFLNGHSGTVITYQPRTAPLLLFMFHHYLMAERLPAWDALRQAQLWMLDPRRHTPASMPTRLRLAMPGQDLTTPAAWAGLAHWGQ